MARYLALVWNPFDAQAAQAAEHLKLSYGQQKKEQILSAVVEDEGLCVYHGESFDTSNAVKINNLASIPKANGAIVGRIYNALDGMSPSTICEKLTEQDAAEIIDTLGKAVLDKFWGRYVAFIRDGRCNTVSVIRDPTGSVPCYYRRIDEVYIFFSHSEDIDPFNLPSPTINFNHIQCALLRGMVNRPTTGLNEVGKILQGECLLLENGHESRRLYWNAADHARRTFSGTQQDATDILRHTVLKCLNAQLGAHQRVLLRLSGGLDSNILLAATRHLRPSMSITSLNYVFGDPSADEGHLASIAAQHANSPLVTRKWSADEVNLADLQSFPRSPEMISRIFSLITRSVETKLYNDTQATAILSGVGGDHVYFQSYSYLAALDYAQQYGLNPGLLRIAHESARIAGISFGSALWQSIRHYLRPRFNPDALFTHYKDPFLSNSADDIDLLKHCHHPWVELARDMPPGKVTHIFYLTYPMILSYADDRATPFNEIIPFFCQPLIELALSIPSHLLMLGGRDRGLARKAFSQMVPPIIIQSQAKAGGSYFFRNLVDRNTTFIKSFLLDGHLAKAGLLNIDQIERSLNPDLPDNFHRRFGLLSFVSHEAWVRQWAD